jgi:phage tail sheath gpL-like
MLGSNDNDMGSVYAATNERDDPEQQAASAYSTAIASSLDPYSLKSGLKTVDDLKNLKSSKKKKQGAFYEKQNALIGELLMPLEEHVENAQAEQRKNRLPVSVPLTYQ